MTFADFLSFWTGNGWIYITAFIIVLSLLVFVHEWGHYIIARACGVKVDVFSIGFGRELFGWNDKHGTRWKFSLIPLGGYVKMFGDLDPASTGGSDTYEDPQTGKMKKMTKKLKEQAFFNKPVWKRASIVFAGPAINYIFAIILLAGVYMFVGKPVTPPVGAAVMVGSAAQQNGFQPHDEILSVDGKDIRSFEDVRREMMISLDVERHFVVKRGDIVLNIHATPAREEVEDNFGFKHSRGLLGLLNPRHAIRIEDIKTIDGREMKSVQEVRIALDRMMDKSFTVGIQRSEEKIDEIVIHPSRERNTDLLEEGSPNYSVLVLGQTNTEAYVQYNPFAAIGAATYESWVITRGTLEALGQMIVGTRSTQELGGIIRIGAIAGNMAQQGFIAIVIFTALLSINLGLINLFPIPVLDGGHLVFYALEAARGKPVSEKVQDFAFQAGFVFLICIMVFANLNDLVQLLM